MVALALLLHTTAALWFGSVVVAALAWHVGGRWIWAIAALIAAVTIGLAGWGPRMDPLWLAAVAEKDYLFPSRGPSTRGHLICRTRSFWRSSIAVA
jgi:hypothetical protein